MEGDGNLVALRIYEAELERKEQQYEYSLASFREQFEQCVGQMQLFAEEANMDLYELMDEI